MSLVDPRKIATLGLSVVLSAMCVATLGLYCPDAGEVTGEDGPFDGLTVGGSHSGETTTAPTPEAYQGTTAGGDWHASTSGGVALAGASDGGRHSGAATGDEHAGETQDTASSGTTDDAAQDGSTDGGGRGGTVEDQGAGGRSDGGEYSGGTT